LEICAEPTVGKHLAHGNSVQRVQLLHSNHRVTVEAAGGPHRAPAGRSTLTSLKAQRYFIHFATFTGIGRSTGADSPSLVQNPVMLAGWSGWTVAQFACPVTERIPRRLPHDG